MLFLPGTLTNGCSPSPISNSTFRAGEFHPGFCVTTIHEDVVIIKTYIVNKRKLWQCTVLLHDGVIIYRQTSIKVI